LALRGHLRRPSFLQRALGSEVRFRLAILLTGEVKTKK
jgi:hypothetical protein